MAIARPRRNADAAESEPAALTTAVRAAGRFDRHLVSPRGGLLAAVPVVAVLGIPIAAGDPVAGITMAAGAMLVGIAWRTAGGRPPLALMATDATLMAGNTFLGSVTGAHHWLHLILLAILALSAGLLISLGQRGAIVGNQAVIAFVVFGRFSEPVPQALGLAGLVLAGGLAQVVFVGMIRWPTPLRGQRDATAAAYRALARLARLATEPSNPSTLPAATALDEAQGAMSSPTLFGDSALVTLRSLVDEGQRIRVQLSVIHALIRQQRSTGASADDPAAIATDRTMALAASCLELAGQAIEGDRDAGQALEQRAGELSALVATLAPTELTPQADSPAPLAASAALNLTRRLSALAGQLRAVASLAPTAGEGGGLRSRRPQHAINSPLERMRADLDQIRANATLQSPAGRHAVRLAVVVVIAEIIANHLPLHRGYWMVVAAATVLRPDFASTFTRGTERALGATLGVALAGAIAVALNPSEATTVVLVGLLAWAAYSVFPASFAAGFGFITALVVFLLNVISPDTIATAEARLLDTLIGGTLGLLAYALWPTWSKTSARLSLAELVVAERDYLRSVLSALVEGRRARDHDMRPLSRRVRLVRTAAEATVARSLSEPQTRRIDAEQSEGTLAVMRRLVQGAHVLRLDAQDDREREPLPALRPLASDLDGQLAIVADELREPVGPPRHDPELPDLRASFDAFEHQSPHDREGAALLAQLDELVDAANGLAELTGLDRTRAGDSQTAARAQGKLGPDDPADPY